MLHTSIDDQLDLLEERLTELSTSLIEGRPDMVQSASASVQLLSVELLTLMSEQGQRNVVDSARLITMREMSGRLASVRENLLRLAAHVERSLALVMPDSQQKATYPGARTYGGPARQSGAFKVLSA